MKLGFAPIDEDHDKVLKLVSEVEGLIAEHAPIDASRQSFRMLVEVTVNHFRSEEHGMEACRYPDLARHKREHEEISDWLTHLQTSFTSATSESTCQWIGSDTIAFLRAWVQQHLLEFDAPMVAFIREKLERGDPDAESLKRHGLSAVNLLAAQ